MPKDQLIAVGIGFVLGLVFGFWLVGHRRPERRVYALYQYRVVAKDEAIVSCKVRAVTAFLTSFGSPLTSYAADFVAAADTHGLDWQLLPVVSCVESSCGKYYRLNAFGWGSDTLDFGDTRQDIFGVAGKVATLPYYAAFRRSGDLRDFALAYNGAHAEDYYGKLRWFKERFNQLDLCRK